MLEYVLKFIYPTRCGICGKLNEQELCKKCENSIKKYMVCKTNKNIKDKYFDEHLYVFKYKNLIRDKLIQYKFFDSAYLYKTFSKIIYKNKKICGFLKKYDIIIPVPIHKKRKTKRGYNQSELIVKDIALNTGIAMHFKVLQKIRNTKPQSSLGKKEREINIKDAYVVNKSEIIFNKNILLFDDIYTTGSTVNECARVLIENGLERESIGVLTKTKH